MNVCTQRCKINVLNALESLLTYTEAKKPMLHDAAIRAMYVI